MPLFETLFDRAAKTGEPIVSPIEYVFPGEGFERIVDEFMLGDSILVAPMLESGSSRKVVLPSGRWKADDGTLYEGGSHDIMVPLDRLPYFERL